ncbi:alpha/beta hydrolase [Streptomyces sp. NPDC059837]|jgi:acetyl esterase/lipase|uniref:alpha/beta hydrolase n=1 Tax=unclassified Streptomyces TaxID=2593676 RepID=UPI003656170B
MTEAPSAPSYAAPARATELTGLPPTFIDVGQVDLFQTENIRFAEALSAAGVEVEFHLYPGAPHGFDVLAPQAQVSTRALETRYRAIKRLLSKQN